MKCGHWIAACLMVGISSGCTLTEIDECHGDVKTCQDNKLMHCENGRYTLAQDCADEGLVCDPDEYACVKSKVCQKGCDGRYIRDCDENGNSKITDCGDDMVCVNLEDSGYTCATAISCIAGAEVYDKETNSCICNSKGRWIEVDGTCVCESGYMAHGEICDRDLNNNHMWDSEETANAQGKPCLDESQCFSARDQVVSAFCDSFLGGETASALCSTKCLDDDSCVDPEIYFCREDGRCVPRVFETVWQVSAGDTGLAFPGGRGEDCNYTIDWGDGSPKESFTSCQEFRPHTYDAPGTYHVRVTGKIEDWACGNPPEKLYGFEDEEEDITEDDEDQAAIDWNELLDLEDVDDLEYDAKEDYPTDDGEIARGCDHSSGEDEEPTEGDEDDDDEDEEDKDDKDVEWELNCIDLVGVESFGPVELGEGAFEGASRLVRVSHVDIPNSSHLTSLRYFFKDAEAFNDDINNWDTSNVEDMSFAFENAAKFNHPLSRWNTSNVEDMSCMFHKAISFDSDISSWNVEFVRYMIGMFWEATKFNQNIESWNVTNVEYMNRMFEYASSFNQPLNKWDVSSVKNLSLMFRGAETFNQPLDHWALNYLTDASYMFLEAVSFNQDINAWEMSGVENLKGMFAQAKAFNQPLGKWSLTDAKNLSRMFEGAESFNQNLSEWNPEKVTDMRYMFSYAKSFNQYIGGWNTESVQDMSHMFDNAVAFNQDLNGWNTGHVVNMAYMFYNAKSFNENIREWNTSNVDNMNGMFSGASAFNQDIGEWNVSNVKYMESMFYHASSFNKPLASWDTSHVLDMSSMFDGALAFDQPIEGWQVSQVLSTYNMFNEASAFLQDLSAWEVGGWDEAKACYEGIFNESKLSTSQEVACTMLNSENWSALDDDKFGFSELKCSE
ncbi:MAG: BspA family leucine-rich repeat surface protein [Proteobacteria bacterium]|nr:BspA family leucine-rich repeat surface protein [Pseudomonadota bacterium]